MELYKDIIQTLSHSYFIGISNMEEISNVKLINIYLRMLNVHITNSMDAPMLPLDSSSSAVMLTASKKHIVKSLRLLGLEYLVPKPNNLYDKKKAFRIISALHDKIAVKFGKDLPQRVNSVVKREQLLLKRMQSKEKKAEGEGPSLQSDWLASQESTITNLPSSSQPPYKVNEACDPATQPGFVIPVGRQIPRTPLKVDKKKEATLNAAPIPTGFNIETNTPKTAYSPIPFSAILSPPPEFKGSLSPPVEFKDHSPHFPDLAHTTPLHQKESDTSLLPCPYPDSQSPNQELSIPPLPQDGHTEAVAVGDLVSSEETLHELKDRRKTYAILRENEQEMPSPISSQDCSSMANSCVLTPPDNFSEKSYTVLNLKNLPTEDSSETSQKRISDIAPLMFEDSLTPVPAFDEEIGKSKERTKFVPKKTNKPIGHHGRETYVIAPNSTNFPRVAHGGETFIVTPKNDSLSLSSNEDSILECSPSATCKNVSNKEECTNELHEQVVSPFAQSSSSLSDFDSLLGDKTTLYKCATNEESILVQKVGESNIIAIKKEPGKKTLVKKTQISGDQTETLITEIYNPETSRRILKENIIPSGRALPRTPPSNNLDVLNASKLLDSSFALNDTCNDLRIQIFVKEKDKSHSLSQKDKASNVKDLDHSSIKIEAGSMENASNLSENNSGTSLEFEDSMSLFPIKKKSIGDIKNPSELNEKETTEPIKDTQEQIQKQAHQVNAKVETQITIQKVGEMEASNGISPTASACVPLEPDSREGDVIIETKNALPVRRTTREKNTIKFEDLDKENESKDVSPIIKQSKSKETKVQKMPPTKVARSRRGRGRLYTLEEENTSKEEVTKSNSKKTLKIANIPPAKHEDSIQKAATKVSTRGSSTKENVETKPQGGKVTRTNSKNVGKEEQLNELPIKTKKLTKKNSKEIASTEVGSGVANGNADKHPTETKLKKRGKTKENLTECPAVSSEVQSKNVTKKTKEKELITMNGDHKSDLTDEKAAKSDEIMSKPEVVQSTDSYCLKDATNLKRSLRKKGGQGKLPEKSEQKENFKEISADLVTSKNKRRIMSRKDDPPLKELKNADSPPQQAAKPSQSLKKRLNQSNAVDPKALTEPKTSKMEKKGKLNEENQLSLPPPKPSSKRGVKPPHSQLVEPPQVQIRSSRRCKVKASSAISDGFNDSLY